MDVARRRMVTAVFVDVVGSTSIGERMDPEAFAQLVDRFYEEVSVVVDRHGGTVEKFIGDAVKASFGIPEAHEDDALRAVRAAVEVREALLPLNDELAERWGTRIEIRIGVNTGEVLSLTRGGQAVALGDAMNVAARLQQSAAPGEILIGAATRDLVRAAVDAEALADLDLKGKRGREKAYRVRSLDPAAVAIPRHLDRPMVGRDTELRMIVDALEHVIATRECSLVAVVGEPGIGKTRLLKEVAERLSDRSTVLSGACLPYGETTTYYAMREIVRTALGRGVDVPETVRNGLFTIFEAEDEAELVADRILQLLGLREASAPPEEVFWAVRKLVEALATDRPLVLIVEDVHWASPPLLDLVQHLAEWTRGASVLLIVSARPDPFDRDRGWDRLARVSLRLQPLTASDSERVVENAAGTKPSPQVHGDLAQVAGGNPLFIEQLVSMLKDEGVLQRAVGVEAVRLPPSIQALLASRLDSLDGGERQVLGAAAVIGQDVGLEPLQELCTAIEPTEIRRIVGVLTSKELLRPERWELGGSETFSFRHALIREAAYRAVTLEQRVLLHERMAIWLGSQDGTPREVVGYHYERAFAAAARLRPLDDDARRLARVAWDLLAAAGSEAHGRQEFSVARQLLARAWKLAKATGEWPVELILRLGQAADSHDERSETMAELEAASQATGDPRFEAQLLVVRANDRMIGDPEYDTAAAVEELERGIALHEAAGFHEALPAAYSLLAYAYEGAGLMQDALVWGRRAVEAAGNQGDLSSEGWARLMTCRVLRETDAPLDEYADAAESLLDFAERSHQRRMQALALVQLALVDVMRDRADAARVTFDAAAERARSAADMGSGQLAAFSMDAAEIFPDDPATAERLLRESYEALTKKGYTTIKASCAARLADVLYRQGRLEEAREAVADARASTALDDVDALFRVETTDARLRAALGDCRGAMERIRAGLDLLDGTEWVVARAAVEAASGEVRARCGDLEGAKAAFARARQLYERKGHVRGVRDVQTLEAHVGD